MHLDSKKILADTLVEEIVRDEIIPFWFHIIQSIHAKSKSPTPSCHTTSRISRLVSHRIQFGLWVAFHPGTYDRNGNIQPVTPIHCGGKM